MFLENGIKAVILYKFYKKQRLNYNTFTKNNIKIKKN